MTLQEYELLKLQYKRILIQLKAIEDKIKDYESSIRCSTHFKF